MIQLRDASTFDHLKNPPTHAQRIFMNVVLKPDGLHAPAEHTGTIMLDRINAYYALGTIEDGKFVHNAHTPIVEVLVDMGDYPDDHPRYAHTQARKNLLRAGVVPHPNDPTIAVDAPNVEVNDFRHRDLDAYFAHFEPRLAGVVV